MIKMKQILFILLVVCGAAKGQYTPNSGAYSYKGLMPLKSLQIPTGCGYPSTNINSPDSSRSAMYFDSCNAKLYRFNPKPKTWSLMADSLNNSGLLIIPGGEFTTSNVGVGYNPGTNLTVQQFISSVWYGLKPPTATLTGGTLLEYTNASTVSQTLNWSAGRQSNTATLSTIVVGGIPQTFAQPAQSATVSGTQVVSVPANTSTTYTNLVTASDGQTASATTEFTFQPRKYYGWISDTTGIGSGAQDAAILALTSTLSNSKSLTVNTGAPGGTKFFVYAYLSSLGTITSISFNGIPADDAMTTISKSLTTANTYSGTYKIIYNKQGQTTSSDVIFQ